MLCIDERGDAAELLRFGDHMERQRRLAARFRAVHFNHAAARKPTDAKGGVYSRSIRSISR